MNEQIYLSDFSCVGDRLLIAIDLTACMIVFYKACPYKQRVRNRRTFYLAAAHKTIERSEPELSIAYTIIDESANPGHGTCNQYLDAGI